VNRFKELIVWQKSIQLVTEVYKITSDFSETEKFGLTSQIRRCAVSIPSNIAEGAGRDGSVEFNRFLSIALGSSFELETQLIVAKELNYISEQNLENFSAQVSHIQNMIIKLKDSLK